MKVCPKCGGNAYKVKEGGYACKGVKVAKTGKMVSVVIPSGETRVREEEKRVECDWREAAPA